MSLLGVHFVPKHTGQHHYDYITALRPDIAKLVGDSTPDVQLMSDMYKAAPNALHYWRNHALSEEHDSLWRDPVGTSQRHVAILHRDIMERYAQAAQRGLLMPERHQVWITGINEPVLELFARAEDMSNYAEWLRMMRERTPLLDAYMYNFGVAANLLGYGAGLGNLSSGQVANVKPGAYPTFAWFPKTSRLLEITRGRTALVQHEYWRAETGPEGWWDWHTCRWFHYEVDCDVHILECGVDQMITSDPPNGNRGWVGHMSPAQYAAQMDTYISRCMTDARFKGATPFTLDGAGEWSSFYVEPCAAEFVQLARSLDARAAQTPTHTVNIPIVTVGTPPADVVTVQTDSNWQRARAFVRKWEGGLSLDENDHGNWTGGRKGQGELKGTNYGISAASYPNLDIRNLTMQQADGIYYRDYWQASGADKLPWPYSLFAFDTAVLHGVGTSLAWQREAGNNPYLFAAKRLRTYTKLDNWSHFGAGWVNRTADLLEEAGK